MAGTQGDGRPGSGRREGRRRRIITAVLGSLAVAGSFLVAGQSSAALTQPMSITAVARGDATAGTPVTVDFTVTNQATNGARLGVVSIVMPKDVTGITRGSTSEPLWSESLLPCGATPRCSGLLFATASKSSAYLTPGDSVTISVTFTPTSDGPLSFSALGVGNGAFSATSIPSITVGGSTPQPAGLRITSITETDGGLPVLHAGRSFDVAFEVVDAAGNVVTSPDVTVKLSAPNLGPLATLTALPVTSSNGKGVITATYTGPNIAGLSLQLAAGSLTSAPVSVDLTAADIAVTLAPGQNVTITIGDITLSTGTATAKLTNGAYGGVKFSIGKCVDADSPTGTCDPAVKNEISLLGDFGDPATTSAPLYTNTAPAEMDWACNDATCKPTGFESGKTTRYELQAAEWRNRPVAVALSGSAASLHSYAVAPRCSGVTGPLTTGQIVEPDAQKAGFCVDSGAITRANEVCTGTGAPGSPANPTCTSWSGTLTVPVLFVKDPRFMGS